jgi:hypothetical protein
VGLVWTFLREGGDPPPERIGTALRSRQALAEMRRSRETPRGGPIFRAAGAKPALTGFEVVENISTRGTPNAE